MVKAGLRAFKSHRRGTVPCLALLALIGCGPAERSDTGGAGAAPPTSAASVSTQTLVRVRSPHRGRIQSAIEVTADIETRQVVDVFPKVGPAYVSEVLVDEGDTVTEGQAIAKLDDADFLIEERRRTSALEQTEQRVKQAKIVLQTRIAQERATKASLERAQADLKRATDATSGGIDVLSRKELADLQKEFEVRQAEFEASSFSREQTESEEKLAELAVEAAQIELDSAEDDLRHTVIRSLIDGKVRQRNVNVGLLVNSSSQIFTLVDPNQLIANLRIPQEELRLIHPGMTVEFRLDAIPGRVILGSVEALNPTVDPGSGLVKVRAKLPDEAVGSVLPGMFARAKVVVESRDDALLLTKRAVIYEDGDSWIFTVKDGIASRRAIEIGSSTVDDVELLSIDGQPPEVSVDIITVGQDRLRDGDPVKVQRDGSAE